MTRRFHILSSVLVAVGLMLLPTAGFASADKGTADEAKAMVEKAAALLKASGPDKAFEAFNDAANKDFHDRDLYIFVRGMDGNTVAHGANGQCDLPETLQCDAALSHLELGGTDSRGPDVETDGSTS